MPERINKGVKQNRTSFSDEALELLIEYYTTNGYPSIRDRHRLELLCNETSKRIQNWFKGRRARSHRLKEYIARGDAHELLTKYEIKGKVKSLERLQTEFKTTQCDNVRYSDDSDDSQLLSIFNIRPSVKHTQISSVPNASSPDGLSVTPLQQYSSSGSSTVSAMHNGFTQTTSSNAAMILNAASCNISCLPGNTYSGEPTVPSTVSSLPNWHYIFKHSFHQGSSAYGPNNTSDLIQSNGHPKPPQHSPLNLTLNQQQTTQLPSFSTAFGSSFYSQPFPHSLPYAENRHQINENSSSTLSDLLFDTSSNSSVTDTRQHFSQASSDTDSSGPFNSATTSDQSVNSQLSPDYTTQKTQQDCPYKHSLPSYALPPKYQSTERYIYDIMDPSSCGIDRMNGYWQ